MARKGHGGMGAGGSCICLGCGTKIPHRSGTPCLQERCPKCGKAMVREGSEHHRAALARRRDQVDS